MTNKTASDIKDKANQTTDVEDNIVSQPDAVSDAATEVGGPKGPEPTRYGDWEKNGRCIDF